MDVRLTTAWLHSPWPWLATASLAGWAALVAAPTQSALPDFCGSIAGVLSALGWRGVTQALSLDPLGLLLAWWMMLLAMMPPLLAAPLDYLWQRSLPRRRPLAVALFLCGYVLVWSLAGLLLTGLSIGLKLLTGDNGGYAALLALGVVLFWQATPVKQQALNHCHYLPRISAFGWAMVRDCLRYGVVKGNWCIAACWPLMLLPMLVEQGHLPLMLVGMLWLVHERQRLGRQAAWRWPLPLPQRLTIATSPQLTKYRSSRSKPVAASVPARR
ncbi:DUF2182 domain-containing protein [Pseudomonas sp. zfem002]|uniref:copper chaperone n=1 Tax=Pseudomonas sp. zfem002 TaxID=3078197 RepID=UPI002928B9E6|nr:DUF2182 domain-containing protein [Pseudomonas sp. zfem002]MDU9392206.1 DUF2182 domain-containing protein [Pseudomonas sp. zfem002]